MGRFNIEYENSEYKKPVDKGSFVYIYDIDAGYEAQTIYKVAYYDEKAKRILVEVDPKKNFIDSKYIKGWDYSSRSIPEEKLYELKKDKLYWWVYAWQKTSSSYVLNNE